MISVMIDRFEHHQEITKKHYIIQTWETKHLGER